MSLPRRDGYDTEITYQHKVADYLDVPYKLVVKIDNPTSYESYETFLQRQLNTGKTLEAIYDAILPLQLRSDRISQLEDIAFTYYRSIKSENALAEINDLYTNRGNSLTQFSTLSDLKSAYKQWKKDLKREKEDDTALLNGTIDAYQNTFRELKSELLEVTDTKINNQELNFQPRLVTGDRLILPEDGPDIFNMIRPSENLTFVQYNPTDDLKDSQFKIYTGVDEENKPNFDVSTRQSDSNTGVNMIYLVLWLSKFEAGKAVTGIHRSPKSNFLPVTFNLETGILNFRVPLELGVTRKYVVDIFKAAFPGLDLGDGIEVKLLGSFTILDLHIFDVTLLEDIFNNEIFQIFVYVDESAKNQANKRRLALHYQSFDNPRHPSSGKGVSRRLRISNAIAGNVSFYLKQVGENVEVNVTDADDSIVLDEFTKVIRALLTLHKKYDAKLKKLYELFIPEIKSLEKDRAKLLETPESTKEKKTGKMTVIKQLRQDAPGVFPPNYARACIGADKQPRVIPTDEVEAYTAQKFVYKGKTYHRRVIAWPNDENPQYYFGCSDKNPFPQNKDLPIQIKGGGSRIEKLPCCYSSTAKKSSERKTGAIKTKADTRLTTHKILPPGHEATVELDIASIVGSYDKDAEISRYGVIRDKNSLIHCICVAINDKEYKKSDDQKKYVKDLRKSLVKAVNLSLLRQELYDKDETEIGEILEDQKLYFDPNLFYRVLEEHFNINIYVFSQPLRSAKTFGTIELPRHRIMHVRPKRHKRRVVCILSHWGSETDAAKYPQNELLVDTQYERSLKIYDTDTDMIDVVHRALVKHSTIITWLNNDPKPRQNMYSFLDYYTLFLRKAKAQFLDSYGKLRALVLDVSDDQGEVTIVVPPSQPENLPVVKNLPKAEYKLVLSTFTGLGKPTSASINSDGYITGLWFKALDLKEGIYIPVRPVKDIANITSLANIKSGSVNPLESDGVNVTRRLSNLKRTLDRYLQVLHYVYHVWLQEHRSRLKTARDDDSTPSRFIEKFVTTGDSEVKDTADLYDIEDLVREFPIVANAVTSSRANDVKTATEAIKILSKQVPSLFLEGKFFSYSTEFTERLEYNLIQYNKLETETPRFVTNYYSSILDYKFQTGVIVLLGSADLKNWKQEQTTKRDINAKVILKQLDLELATRREPYLYGSLNLGIYIIQNLIHNAEHKNDINLHRALNIAQTWSEQKINLGNKPTPLPKEKVQPYVIYGISITGELITLEDHSGTNKEYNMILQYNDISEHTRYAAILPLLK